MAVSSFSMAKTESAAVFGSCNFDPTNIESKEAGFMVLGPWATCPPDDGRCMSATGALAGGTVLPPQYKRAINVTAAASVI